MIVIPDLINGCFEFCGSLAIFGHCREILKDKIVKGVNWKSVVFFSSWGAYNTFFYSNLNQWWSFTGGLFIFAANIYWMYLLWKYWDRSINKKIPLKGSLDKLKPVGELRNEYKDIFR